MQKVSNLCFKQMFSVYSLTGALRINLPSSQCVHSNIILPNLQTGISAEVSSSYALYEGKPRGKGFATGPLQVMIMMPNHE